MQKRCISFTQDKKKYWINYQMIKEDIELLEKNETELSDTAKAQNDNTPEGHVAQKKQELLLLGKALYKLNRNLCHFAKKTNNQILLQIVDISESALISGEEKEIILKFRAILDAARANLLVLDPYGITSASLDKLEAELKGFINLPKTIGLLTGNRKSAKRSIKELNAEARIILDRLDDAFEGMITDEKFLEGWFDARKIKGRHSGGKKNHDITNGDLLPVK